MQTVTLKELLEAGCHFGHQVKRWHPKAARYIYGARDGIHIIDLAHTRDCLASASEFVQNLGSSGKQLLFVATKRQAKVIVSAEAKRVGAPYLTHRWIGGFITNWDEVKKNLEKVRSLRQDRDSAAWEKFPKHEQVKLAKTLTKLEGFYGGVAEEVALPDAVFIVDIRKEDSAVREATLRGIPIIAIVDTNSDPTRVEYPIPANDDAVGSISIITKYIADAFAEGKDQLAKKKVDKEVKEKEVEAPKEASEKPAKKRTTKRRKTSAAVPEKE